MIFSSNESTDDENFDEYLEEIKLKKKFSSKRYREKIKENLNSTAIKKKCIEKNNISLLETVDSLCEPSEVQDTFSQRFSEGDFLIKLVILLIIFTIFFIYLEELNLSIDESSTSSNLSSSSLSEYENLADTNLNKFIYLNAPVTLKEFETLFYACSSKMSLSEQDKEIFFEFIKTIIPSENFLTESYYLMNKTIKLTSEVTVRTLCGVCERPMVNSNCSSETCFSNKMKKKKIIKVAVSNLESQILNTLSNHYDTICTYKGLNLNTQLPKQILKFILFTFL